MVLQDAAHQSVKQESFKQTVKISINFILLYLLTIYHTIYSSSLSIWVIFSILDPVMDNEPHIYPPTAGIGCSSPCHRKQKKEKKTVEDEGLIGPLEAKQ